MGNKELDSKSWDDISMSSSNIIGERSDSKWWLSTGTWVDLSKRRLSHALLAEKSKKAIKEKEKRLDSKGNDIELNEHKKQLENAFLSHYQAAFVESQLSNFDLSSTIFVDLNNLWFDSIEEFKSAVTNEDYIAEYLSVYETKEEKEAMLQAINQIYEKCVSLELSDKKIRFLESKIKEKKEEIEKLFWTWNDLQKQADDISEQILDLISSWALEQRLYLWNEAYLKDSVLGEEVDDQLKKIIDMYKNREYVESHGLKLPKTILLFWETNSWKNFAAKVLSTEIWRDMYTINKQDIWWWTFWDDPISALKLIFLTIAEKKKPCIIFLDEIDKILDTYKSSVYQETVWNTILSHMMYVKDSDLDIITIWGITNKNAVDGDFLKYDNFWTQIFLPDLDNEKRIKYFEILKWKYTSKNVDFVSIEKDKLIDMLSGYSKDVIKKLVDMAVESAVTRNVWWGWKIVHVEQFDFDKALSIIKWSEETKNKKYLGK